MHKLKVTLMFALGLGMGLALHVTGAQAENRPYGELNYFQALNGEVSRLMNVSASGVGADGGGLSLWSSDAGPGCNNVPTGGVYEIHCNAAGHFCPWGTDGGTAGSFCNTTIGNVGYGRPVNASTASAPAPFFYTAPPGAIGTTKNICYVPSASASGTCAVFKLN